MPSHKSQYILFVDGASRGNPGKAGVGIYVKKDDVAILKEGFSIGLATNNTAEYTALAAGLFLLAQRAANAGDTEYNIKVHSDSQLLVRQIQGIYRVKTPHIERLKLFCEKLLQNKTYTIEHVRRENNSVADELANVGIDKKYKLPEDFLKLAAQNNVQVG
ncbi:ribonuclease HI family protein [Candidatus Babeliales bacterium]|nr:ribonuclease HI family protein [Candidatus Babeliales bacterium]